MLDRTNDIINQAEAALRAARGIREKNPEQIPPKPKQIIHPQVNQIKKFDLEGSQTIDLYLEKFFKIDLKNYIDKNFKRNQIGFNWCSLVIFENEPEAKYLYFDKEDECFHVPHKYEPKSIEFDIFCLNFLYEQLQKILEDFEIFISQYLGEKFIFWNNGGLFIPMKLELLSRLWDEFIKKYETKFKYLLDLFWLLILRLNGCAQKSKEKNLKFHFKDYFNEHEKSLMNEIIFELVGIYLHRFNSQIPYNDWWKVKKQWKEKDKVKDNKKGKLLY